MTNKEQTQTPAENAANDNLTNWFMANLKTVIAVAVTIFVMVGIFAVVMNLREKDYQKQWSDVFLAEIAVANGGDETSYAPLEEIATKYKTKPAGVYAAFVLATALSQQGEFLKAEIFYKQALENANDEFAAMITNALVANTLELGDYERAINLADDFIAHNPTHFSVPQLKLYKALGLELAGKIEESKAIFKSLEEDYPQTYYAAIASAKLAPTPKAEPKKAPAKKTTAKKGSKKAKK